MFRFSICLFLAFLFLLLPESSFADIENLYAEGHSSSVTITNPLNAYGAPDGNTADSKQEGWGADLDHWTFTMADSGNTTEVFQTAEFYITHYNKSLRSITRMGLSPLVSARLVFARIQLAERWPLVVAIAVIFSVLLYMDLLIRKNRSLATKSAPHKRSPSSARDYVPQRREPRELRKLQGSFSRHRR